MGVLRLVKRVPKAGTSRPESKDDPTPAHLRSRPKGREPELPTNPSNLTDHALMELFASYVVHLQYAKVAYAKAVSRAADSRRREKILRAKAFLSASGNRETRSANVELNPEVEAITEAAVVAESEAGLYFAIFEGYAEAKALLSRELTRRVDLEKSRGQG